MSDKISKKLIMGERFLLLGVLPQPDFVTYKILRKLKETLSPSEEEIKAYDFKSSLRCFHKEFDEKGKASMCEYETESKETQECPIHKEPMRHTGRVSWAPEMWNQTKEIWFGAKAHSIIVEALKNLSEETKKINGDLVLSLYEKFGEAEEE